MPKFNRGRTSPKIIVSGVVRTGRFRLRPGRWWECQTFIVEIEELISYANLQDFMPVLDEPGKPSLVWRRGNMSDMLNCPGELFDPRAMVLADDLEAHERLMPAPQWRMDFKDDGELKSITFNERRPITGLFRSWPFNNLFNDAPWSGPEEIVVKVRRTWFERAKRIIEREDQI